MPYGTIDLPALIRTNGWHSLGDGLMKTLNVDPTEHVVAYRLECRVGEHPTLWYQRQDGTTGTRHFTEDNSTPGQIHVHLVKG